MSPNILLFAKLTGLAFIITSMISAGLAVRPKDVLAQVRRTRLVALSLLANFVAAPVFAWAITKVIPIESGYAIGLLLISGAAGAPLLPKLAERARANVPFAIALMMLLVVVTVGFMPLVMPQVIPGLQASAWRIAFPLILMIGLPLIVGVVIHAAWEAGARRLEPVFRHASDVFLVLFVILVIATHLDALWGALGSGAILAALLFVLLSGTCAYGLGGPDRGTRRVLALGTAQRNVAAALVTAGSSFSDQPKVVVMVLVTDVVGLVVLIMATTLFRRSGDA